MAIDTKPRTAATDQYRTQEQVEGDWLAKYGEFWWLMERLIRRGIDSNTAAQVAAQLVTEPRRK